MRTCCGGSSSRTSSGTRLDSPAHRRRQELDSESGCRLAHLPRRRGSPDGWAAGRADRGRRREAARLGAAERRILGAAGDREHGLAGEGRKHIRGRVAASPPSRPICGLHSRTCSARTAPATAAGACTGGSALPIARDRARRNKAAFREVVKHGPPPGLLAFDGDVAVGWCQLTPRDALPWLDRTWRLKRVDDVPVWSLSCFYVRKGYRRQGVTSALIAAALKAAKRAKARALEAYPLDADETPSASSYRLRLDLRAGRIQESCSAHTASPDHAPRSEGDRARRAALSRGWAPHLLGSHDATAGAWA